MQLSDPERELAISYAPHERRAVLRALWALDERFGAIVASSTESAIGEMRLLWWREALEKLGEGAPAEPLLQYIEAVVDAAGRETTAWGAIAEGWFALLRAPVGEPELQRFAARRGGRLFALSAAALGADGGPDIGRAGQGWALADLAHRSSDPELARMAAAAARRVIAADHRRHWPRPLRPLGALSVMARRDAWKANRRQGAPSRVARMAWHRLTGR